MVESLLEHLVDSLFHGLLEKSFVFLLMAIMIIVLGVALRHVVKVNEKLQAKALEIHEETYKQLREDRERDVDALIENTRALQIITTILEMSKK